MKPRIRVGQQYLDEGEPRTPSGTYLNVISLEPLTVQPEGWHGSRGFATRTIDRDDLSARLLLRDPELEDEEIREVLIGRTITAVAIHHDRGEWAQGDGDLTLTLDDGRRVGITSWGYDAWGLGIDIDPPLGAQEADHAR